MNGRRIHQINDFVGDGQKCLGVAVTNSHCSNAQAARACSVEALLVPNS